MVKSERAFERLTFQEALPAPRAEWLARRELRDIQARESYFDVERNARVKGDLFVGHIIDEEILPGDPRLFLAATKEATR